MLENGIVPASAGGYEIANSLRLNDDDSAYLSWTPSSAGNRKTWTWSGWVKRGNLGTQQTLFGQVKTGGAAGAFSLRFNADDKLKIHDWHDAQLELPMLFRDTSAWYHILLAWDTTQATESNRAKLYINGVEETLTELTGSAGTGWKGYPPQDDQRYVNAVEQHTISSINPYYSANNYIDGYLAEVNFIDGQALDPSNFGETGDYGEWKPIRYTGTYGTNGFYLDFENSGSLGADQSGNSNNWTPNNLAATDQMLDSPTNNFCTWNAVEPTPTGIFAEGNTHYYANAVTTKGAVAGTMGFSGKFYWEVFSSSTNQYHTEKVGIVADGFSVNQNIGYDSVAWGYGSNGSSQYKWNNNSGTFLGSRQIGDIQMIAVDTDAGKVWFGRNGTWEESGNPATGANAQYTNVSSVVRPATSVYNTQNGIDGSIANFGQDSSFAGNKTAQGNTDGNGYGDFYYTPPSGFLALCTQNLPDPTVIPSEHFNTVTYTGDGATGRAITGVGFQPDWVWIKSRNIANNNSTYDAVRGAGYRLVTNDASAESLQTNKLKSFDSDGFTTDGATETNGSGNTYVSWNWKANGSGSSNTNGSITSTVSANQDAGFSIVSYTGTGSAGTVGHGLSQAPELVIQKGRSYADNWHIGSTELSYTSGDFMRLNSTGAVAQNTNIWNSTAPTANVFSLGTDGGVNTSGSTNIAYCFHSVDGFSKVGSYTGNGSTDGTFVYTGFRPAYVMIKRTDVANNWVIHDNDRSPDNPAPERLIADLADAEYNSLEIIDLLSNGFKLRIAGDAWNTSGGTMIYIAFAEVPFSVGGGIAR